MTHTVEQIVEQHRELSRRVREDAKDPAKARAFLSRTGTFEADQSSAGPADGAPAHRDLEPPARA